MWPLPLSVCFLSWCLILLSHLLLIFSQCLCLCLTRLCFQARNGRPYYASVKSNTKSTWRSPGVDRARARVGEIDIECVSREGERETQAKTQTVTKRRCLMLLYATQCPHSTPPPPVKAMRNCSLRYTTPQTYNTQTHTDTQHPSPAPPTSEAERLSLLMNDHTHLLVCASSFTSI